MTMNISSYENILKVEGLYGTRAIAEFIINSSDLAIQSFHFLWLVRRNYTTDISELISRFGTASLVNINDESITEIFNHLPDPVATAFAHNMFWSATFYRRVFLRPYITDRKAINTFNIQYLKDSAELLDRKAVLNVVEYLRKKGQLHDARDTDFMHTSKQTEIILTNSWKIVYSETYDDSYSDKFNYGLKYIFSPKVRTIKYQFEFIKNGTFHINDNFGIRYESTRQKLVRCGDLGLVLAYYFPTIDLVVVVRGWIAWPILTYDCKTNTIVNTEHKSNENVEDYKKFLELITWEDSVSIEDSRCLLIGFNQNIAHFYHNELSGLHNLYLSGDIKKIDKIICLPYIPIDLESFLLHLGINVPVVPYKNEQATMEEINKSKFVARVTDITVSRKLSMDLLSYGHSNIVFRGATNSCDVYKILITIRTGRRRLLNLIDCLVASIKFLNNRLGKVLIVFDGVTTVPFQDTADLIAVESGIVNEIIEKVNAGSQVSYESIIGHTLAEKIVAISQCDFAITNMGNGLLPTTQWIADLPTFVHGNSTDNGIIWETNLGEDLKRPFIVSPRVIKDTSSSAIIVAGQWDGRQNDSYHIDPIDFLDQLSIFLSLKYFN